MDSHEGRDQIRAGTFQQPGDGGVFPVGARRPGCVEGKEAALAVSNRAGRRHRRKEQPREEGVASSGGAVCSTHPSGASATTVVVRLKP